MNILVVDDEKDGVDGLVEFLREIGHQVDRCANAEAALRQFQARDYPLVISDLCMPGMSGIDLLKAIKTTPRGRDCDIIILTGFADMETAIACLRAGAYDYIPKPVNVNELALTVERCAEHRALLQENLALTRHFKEEVRVVTDEIRAELEATRVLLQQSLKLEPIIAQSEAMKGILEKAQLYHAHPDIPVMLEGETGTGKEVIARLIHYGQGHIATPFVDINCSAISPALFESELFGYEPGAFTGGDPHGVRGKLELADAGSLFLDEIGDMTLELQPKLLRVLQERTFYRIGGIKKRSFTARCICASNRPLTQMLEAHAFRRDLYHRLKVGHLVIPPLRERRDDILPLAKHFLRRESALKKRTFETMDNSATDLLLRHPWPGNVRELEHTIERAVLEGNGRKLTEAHLRFLTPAGAPPPTTSNAAIPNPALGLPFPLPTDRLDLEQLNRTLIEQALEKFKGNITKTALYLGISRNSLYCRIKK